MDWGILLTYLSVSLFGYVAGIYFHSKIIRVSLKDKDMSWQLDIIYSCVKVFVNTFAYFLYAVTYITPNLYHFTGRWFCYATKLTNFQFWRPFIRPWKGNFNQNKTKSDSKLSDNYIFSFLFFVVVLDSVTLFTKLCNKK